MMTAVMPTLTLPQIAQMAEGDLVVRNVPREPGARESLAPPGRARRVDRHAVPSSRVSCSCRSPARAQTATRSWPRPSRARAAAALCARAALPSGKATSPGRWSWSTT